MTPAQFHALAKLMRLQDNPSTRAARLVLVDGQPVPAAALATGAPYKAAHAAVQRCRAALELARVAAGP
jgi:hypothetical protein